MKKLIAFPLFLIGFSLFAQEQLIVKYEYKAQIDQESLEMQSTGKNIDPEIKKAIIEAMTEPKYYTLRLTPTESEFKKEEKIDNSQPKDGFKISISMGGESPIYKNLNENIYLRPQNIGNKDFLIKDSLAVYSWKVSKESKEIMGYETRKAEFSDSTQRVTAWYAPKLPLKNGPQLYQGLPGLILELKIERIGEKGKKKDMTETYSVLSIDVNKNPTEFIRPKKGKVLNEEEFSKAATEQHEKMKEMYGNGVDKD